jgi:hypothetical protein
MNSLSLVIVTLAICVPLIVFAKRPAPRKVESVLTPTLRIEAPLDSGRIGRIQAFDRTDGKLLWTIVVFENQIDPRIEEDVQWRFIESMRVVGDALVVTAEGGSRYRVMLATRKIERLTTSKAEANQSSEPTRGTGLRFRPARERSPRPCQSKKTACAEPRAAHL